jgi:NADH-quinone oxidoreductase subunit H
MDLVSIPFLEPLVNYLLGIPVLGFVIKLLLWRPVFTVIFVPGALAILVALIYVIWFERKIAARVQWRYGPLEVSRRLGGFLQPIADLLRFLFQEVVVSREVQLPYFIHVPVVAFTLSLAPILFIPMGPHLYAIYTPYGVIIAVVLLSVFNLAVLAMGWSGNDRFTFIGTVREALMYVAYEVPFLASVVAMLMIYGNADPFNAVKWQMENIPGALANPLALIAFAVAGAMSTSRFPFEIPEADTELVLGPYTEYSGILFGLAFTLGYEKTYVVAALMTLLFFSGWSGLEIAPLGDLSPALWFYIKVIAIMMAYAFLRAVYARFRPDQALRIGWSTLLALSLGSLVVSTLWSIT